MPSGYLDIPEDVLKDALLLTADNEHAGCSVWVRDFRFVEPGLLNIVLQFDER